MWSPYKYLDSKIPKICIPARRICATGDFNLRCPFKRAVCKNMDLLLIGQQVK